MDAALGDVGTPSTYKEVVWQEQTIVGSGMGRDTGTSKLLLATVLE